MQASNNITNYLNDYSINKKSCKDYRDKIAVIYIENEFQIPVYVNPENKNDDTCFDGRGKSFLDKGRLLLNFFIFYKKNSKLDDATIVNRFMQDPNSGDKPKDNDIAKKILLRMLISIKKAIEMYIAVAKQINKSDNYSTLENFQLQTGAVARRNHAKQHETISSDRNDNANEVEDDFVITDNVVNQNILPQHNQIYSHFLQVYGILNQEYARLNQAYGILNQLCINFIFEFQYIQKQVNKQDNNFLNTDESIKDQLQHLQDTVLNDFSKFNLEMKNTLDNLNQQMSQVKTIDEIWNLYHLIKLEIEKCNKHLYEFNNKKLSLNNIKLLVTNQDFILQSQPQQQQQQQQPPQQPPQQQPQQPPRQPFGFFAAKSQQQQQQPVHQQPQPQFFSIVVPTPLRPNENSNQNPNQNLPPFMQPYPQYKPGS